MIRGPVFFRVLLLYLMDISQDTFPEQSLTEFSDDKLSLVVLTRALVVSISVNTLCSKLTLALVCHNHTGKTVPFYVLSFLKHHEISS